MVTIKNETKILSYGQMGTMIDRYLNSELNTTNYVGKEDYFGFVCKEKNYECKVIYLKTGCKFIFEEVKGDKRK